MDAQDEQARSDRLRNAQITGEYIDEFTTPVPVLRGLDSLPKCLTRDKNGKVILKRKLKPEGD